MNAYQRFIVGLTADCVDFLRSENYEIDAEETARLVCGQIYPDQATYPDAWVARVQEVKVIVELYLETLETHARRETAN